MKSDEKIFAIAIAPYFFIMLVLTAVPVVFLIYISFTGLKLTNIGGTFSLIGLDNFIQLLSDQRFLNSMWVTVKFITIQVAIQLVLGLFIALLLNNIKRGATIIKSLFVVPLVVPPVLVGLIFRVLCTPQLGGFGWVSDIVGLPAIDWLSSPSAAFWAVIMAAVWVWTPYVILMYSAALESLPKEPFEAAKIDGASTFQTLYHVTLPLLKPVTYIVIFFRILEAMAIFPIIYTMTSGGPAQATEPTNYLVFQNAFHYYKIGYAAAMMLVFFGLLIIFNLFFVRGIIKKL
jgi:ABC-type sugar transport system permease subunit